MKKISNKLLTNSKKETIMYLQGSKNESRKEEYK